MKNMRVTSPVPGAMLNEDVKTSLGARVLSPSPVREPLASSRKIVSARTLKPPGAEISND